MRWIDNKNIAIILSEKSDGDMLFTQSQIHTDDKRINADGKNEKVKINRLKFFQKNNIDPLKVANIAGSHGNDIYTIKEQDLTKGALNSETRIKDADGLITNIKNSYLMVTGADCFPIFFYNEQNKVIGVIHCGWRGVIKNIISAIIDKFKENFNSQPENLKIWVGPGIKSCHFEVKKDVVESFKEKYETAIIKKDDKYYIDLPIVIKSQLIELCISPENITEYPDCTFCEREKWFSYRRDKLENPEKTEMTKIIQANAYIIHLK